MPDTHYRSFNDILGTEIVNFDQLFNHVTKTANEEMLPFFQNLNKYQIHEKGPNDPVTDIDRRTEELLEKKLLTLLPNSRFLGEETISSNPSCIRELNAHGAIWLIDPLDGTRNYINGSEDFCSMGVLILNGETTVSFIYSPCKKWFVLSVANKGAWLKEQCHLENATITRIEVNQQPIANRIGHINFKHIPQNKRMSAKEEVATTFGVDERLHCAGVDFVHQVLSKRHFSYYASLHPWDHAPGVLLAQEAGLYCKQIANRQAPTPIKAAIRMVTAYNEELGEKLAEFMTLNETITNNESN